VGVQQLGDIGHRRTQKNTDENKKDRVLTDYSGAPTPRTGGCPFMISGIVLAIPSTGAPRSCLCP
jgi:hypothetical protein